LLASSLLLMLGCHSFNLFFKDTADDKTTEKEPPVRPQTDAPSKFSLRVAPYVFLSDFEITTDLPLFRELAGLRDQVYRELKLPTGNDVIQVYLFQDRPHYKEFMAKHHPKLPDRRAFFLLKTSAMGAGRDLLVYAYQDARIQQDLRHELTHALLHSVLKDVPIWLDEGLAEYFELPKENHGINRDHVDTLRRPGVPIKFDLARLESIQEVNDMKAPEYCEAWAWVHFLLHGPPEGRSILLGYLAQLRHDAHPPPLTPQLLKALGTLDDLMEKHLAGIDWPMQSTRR
jgi:hypothetical protein